MEHQPELEMVILAGLWSLDKIDTAQFNKELFTETQDEFQSILNYRNDGNPPGDIMLSQSILGTSLTKELMFNLKYISIATFPHYIRQLKLLRYKQKMFKAVQSDKLDPEILEEGLVVYRGIEKDGNLYDMNKNLQDYVNDLEKRIKKEVVHFELGFKRLDDYISPLEPGMFLIIKALKKTGKTNFAIRIFINMIKKKIPSLYITSEMGYFKLMDKVLSVISNISATTIRKGNLNPLEIKLAVNTISTKMADKLGFIYQTGMFDINKISELVNQTNAKMLFIDYLQMFRVEGDTNRAEALEKIACQIKDLAMTKNIIVFGLSQVNKDGDTKYCLSFEEKADQVISLKTKDDTNETVKTLDISVDFNRYGSTGSVPFVLKRSTCDMAEMDYKEKSKSK